MIKRILFCLLMLSTNLVFASGRFEHVLEFTPQVSIPPRHAEGLISIVKEKDFYFTLFDFEQKSLEPITMPFKVKSTYSTNFNYDLTLSSKHQCSWITDHGDIEDPTDDVVSVESFNNVTVRLFDPADESVTDNNTWQILANSENAHKITLDFPKTEPIGFKKTCEGYVYLELGVSSSL